MTELDYKNGCNCIKLPWLYKNEPDEEIENEEDDFNPFDESIISEDEIKAVDRMVEDFFRMNNIQVKENFTFSAGNNTATVHFVRENADGIDIYDLYYVARKNNDSDDEKEIKKKIQFEKLSYIVHLARESGENVKSVNAVFINKNYVKNGEIECKDFFIIYDCTKEVFETVPAVSAKIAEITQVLTDNNEPQITPSKECVKCSFRDYCLGDFGEHSIFNIRGLKADKKIELFNQGIKTFEKIVSNHINLGHENYNRQVDFEINNRDHFIDKERLKEFIEKLEYPLYFLDFETFSPIIPLYDNSRPMEVIVSQFSLHIWENPEQDLEDVENNNKSFLGDGKTDPRRGAAEALCKYIGPSGSVLAHHSSYEKGCLERLARLYPDLSDYLLGIADRLVDQESPFKNTKDNPLIYYRKEFQGSSSIKKVLPGLFPDNDNLDYHKVFPAYAVHDGMEAVSAYKKICSNTISDSEREEIRTYLLKYCNLDTWAEVLILNELMKARG